MDQRDGTSDDGEEDDLFEEEMIEVEDDDNEIAVDDNDEEDMQGQDEDLDTMELTVEDMSSVVFMQHSDCVYCVSIHPIYPNVILTGGGDDKGFLWRYDHSGITANVELLGHSDTVTSVGFNFNGSLFFTGGYDGIIQIWKIIDVVQLQVSLVSVIRDGPEDIECATWHPKGNCILGSSRDGTSDEFQSSCIQVLVGHEGEVTCGDFTSDGKHVITGSSDGTIRLWNPKTGGCKGVFPCVNQLQLQLQHRSKGMMKDDEDEETTSVVTCLTSSRDGELLLAGSTDGSARLFQVISKRLLQTFAHCSLPIVGSVSTETEETGGGGVECVGFSNDDVIHNNNNNNRWIATGGTDKNLKIWDSVSGICRCVCIHQGGVVSLQWHPSLSIVATGSLDHCVRVWEPRTGNLLIVLTGHTDLVTFVRWTGTGKEEGDDNNNNNSLVSVSDDKTCRLFRLDVNSLLVS